MSDIDSLMNEKYHNAGILLFETKASSENTRRLNNNFVIILLVLNGYV